MVSYDWGALSILIVPREFPDDNTGRGVHIVLSDNYINYGSKHPHCHHKQYCNI